MKRKIIGIVGALALASVGTIVLMAYVQSARNQAGAAEAMVEVWVVKTAIPEGTPSADIEGALERTEVPSRFRAEGGVDDLDDLDGLVTNTDLVPGEQLVAGRFITPTAARQGDVPADLLQVTLELDPQRALGGRVRAGDTVAVLLSFPPFDLEGAVIGGDGGTDTVKSKTPNTTHLELHDVLVASVQIADNAGIPEVAGEGAADEDVNENAVSSAPTESLLVTLAVSAKPLEQIVFAAEFGTVWLAGEPIDAPEDGTRIVDRGNVYDSAVAR